MKKMNNKAAMEMSVGTIVTIVLLMTVLVLGLVLVRTIFISSVDNVKAIDQAVKNEITKLFSEDSSRKVVVYPDSRLIKIKKGNDDESGFAFSIRNVENTEGTFTYTISVKDPQIREKCNINSNEAEAWIVAGREGTVTLPPGTVMQDPEFVRFMIPASAPPCLIRYGIDVKKEGAQYNPTLTVDLRVQSA